MRDIDILKQKLGKRAGVNEVLSKYCFLRIGGPADIYFEARTTKEFIKVILLARSHNIPVTILGEGSNVLISDAGIRGLVLTNKANEIEILDKATKKERNSAVTPRWESDSKVGTFKYEFKDLDYDESNYPRVKVKMESGVILPQVIDFLLKKKVTGLQWYAGIPGTIGGAIFNNIHGGTHFISEVLEYVRVLDKRGKSKKLSINDLGIDYDKSRFQESGEIILDAVFLLYTGDVNKAMYVKKEWAKRKSLQPRNSPGCAFQNLTQKQKTKLGFPTTSVGFIIEHKLNLSGFRVGDAAISKKHHNFVVNEGKATAADYLTVVKEIYYKAKEKLGVTLVPEIFFLGFNNKEVGEFRSQESLSLRKTRKLEIKKAYKNSKKLFSKP